MKKIFKVFKVLFLMLVVFGAGFIEGICCVSRDIYEFGDDGVNRAKDLGRSSSNLRATLRKLKGGA